MAEQITSFPPEVCDSINYYVYRLVDPRNGETFYVGKGKDNRIFHHAAAALTEDLNENEDEISTKIKRIREIHAEGLEVICIIHRHGMDNEDTAYEVEAALIDAYPGLANEQSGHGSERGLMSTKEIIECYGAEEADLSPYKGSLIIKIRQSVVDGLYNGDIYETVRQAWKLKASLVENNDVPYVFATINGIIEGVFVPDEWYVVPDSENRFAFNGHEAEELSSLIGQRIPDRYRGQGEASPFRYIQ